MTIGLAWIGRRADGREHLYIASDSRVTGGHRFDACPKILTLPRSDCALCFAGQTAATYPLMIQMAYAIAAHEPARDRSLDIARVKSHLLKVFTDLIGRLENPVQQFSATDAQFLFAGYSWVKKDFLIWTIHYLEIEKKFAAREATSFLPCLRKAAFIGDWARTLRSRVAKQLSGQKAAAYLEPLRILSDTLKDAGTADTIGGPPQIVRLTQHMSTRPLCVKWQNEDTLFGRPLFGYENTDYWIIDPYTGRIQKPRKFGYRNAIETNSLAMNNTDENVDPG
jgi:hypothetical protein